MTSPNQSHSYTVQPNSKEAKNLHEDLVAAKRAMELISELDGVSTLDLKGRTELTGLLFDQERKNLNSWLDENQPGHKRDRVRDLVTKRISYLEKCVSSLDAGNSVSIPTETWQYLQTHSYASHVVAPEQPTDNSPRPKSNSGFKARKYAAVQRAKTTLRKRRRPSSR